MRTIRTIEEYGFDEDFIKAEELNLRRAGMDNNFLLQAVAENRITQNDFNKIQLIKEVLQHVYPDLWDLQLQVFKTTLRVRYDLPVVETAPVQPFGCYFGKEGFDEYGDIDTREYYLENPVPAPVTIQEEILTHEYYSFHFTVRFPELEIRNTRDETHIIRDLYYRFCFHNHLELATGIRSNSRTGLREAYHVRVSSNATAFNVNADVKMQLADCQIDTNIYGARSTVTTIEYNRNYAHSHLNCRRGPQAFTQFQSCCLGDGEIRMTLARLRSEHFNRELITFFLFQLDAYAKWESIEGGPYISINTLNKNKPVTNFPAVNVENYIERLKPVLRRRKDTNTEINLDWKIENGEFKIVDNERFENFCKYNQELRSSTYLQNEAFYKDSQNNYYALGEVNVHALPRLDDNELYYFTYQGRKMHLTVILPEGTTDILPSEFILNPNLKQAIKNKLEGHANYKKIKGDITARARQISDRRLSAGQNQVPLQINS